MMIRRAMLLGALACAVLPGVARAEKKKGGEILQPGMKVLVEYWDREGLFHIVDADLTIVLSKEGVKVGKMVSDKIHKTLASMPWEEVTRGNVALTLKQIALDACRTDPTAGQFVEDVLIARLMLR